LNGHALHNSHHEARQIGAGDIRRQIALRSSALESLPQQDLIRRATCAKLITNGFGSFSA
jgi:hypothetical protein